MKDRDLEQAIIKPTRSAATREKLILAAEAMFGEEGFDAVALRSIVAVAEQRNSNVVQYHFGDKFGLLDAIFEYRAAQIAPVRRRMLQEAHETGRADDVKTLLRCAMAPEFEIWRQEGTLNYIRLTVYYMLYLRPRGIDHPYDRNSAVTSTLHEVMLLLSRRLSHMSEDRLTYRAETVTTALMIAMLTITQREKCGEPMDILIEDALEMMTAAMCAPPWNNSTSR